jgi:ribonuclease J
MRMDIDRCGLRNGVFIYSLWSGYRYSNYQQSFEKYLKNKGFCLETLHTSGHAAIADIKRKRQINRDVALAVQKVVQSR